MKQASIVTIFIIILLTACSSHPQQKTQYYLLNSPTNTNTLDHNNEEQQNIVVDLLELPEYLKQPSLVLQLSSHQLHYSHFHMWAEPLQDSRFHYVANTNVGPKALENKITVDITAFHATHQSQAILKGTFSIHDNNITITEKNRTSNFAITLPLNKNGYEHAVEQMRSSIKQLAEQIINQKTK
jgi:uncharacterized lipoprotein YmbA